MPAHSEFPACSEREAYLRSALRTRDSVRGTLNRVLALNPPMVFFGETHGRNCGAGERGYSYLIQELKRLSFAPDCLFLEASETEQFRIDDYLAGRIPYADIAAKRNLAAAHQDLLDQARFSRIRVVAVDQPTEGLAWPADPLVEGVFIRNQRMAERIHKFFADGSCVRGAMPVGSVHLSIFGRNSADVPLNGVLRSRFGIASVSVFLESARCDLRSQFRWPECSWNLSLTDADYGFLTDAPSPPMIPRSFQFPDALPRWDAFSAVLVLP